MTGGLIQLVAYGVHDIFLTQDPQITFFKVVYRRHTHFSTEPIAQYFTHVPDFGRKVTCQISRNGDLIRNMDLVVTLPSIRDFLNEDGTFDQITKVAWVRKIGYAIIKSIEVEIGGLPIDKHYGEWLHIWAELTEIRDQGYKNMIGDIDELYDFTSGKDEYTLYIPLKFWFNKYSGLSLPIIALGYSEVKINLELEDLEKCLITTPTHYIETDDALVNFKVGEYIYQINGGENIYGMVSYFSPDNRRLYYKQISNKKFVGITASINPNDVNFLENKQDLFNKNQNFYLIGMTTGFKAMPKINSVSSTYTFIRPRNINLKQCFLLVEYVYLDEEERIKFIKTKHDYLIERLALMSEKTISSYNQTVKLDIIQPTKILAWVVQNAYFKELYNNDHFNYTTSFYYHSDGSTRGNSLIREQTVMLNGHDRLTDRNYGYFNYYQPFNHFSAGPVEGINVYSFGLYPEKHQPSGTCNMSQIDKIDVRMNLDFSVTVLNPSKFRAYGLTYNVLRIVNGIAGLVFTR